MKADKLNELCEIEGFSSLEDLLDEYCTDSVCPGICVNEGCDYTTEVEPDQSQGWCEICGTQSVCSAMMLAGII